MTETPSIFEPDLYKPKLSRYYEGLIACAATYIVICCWGILRQHATTSHQIWPLLLMFLLAPVCGLLLFLAKKKIGWSISLCYFLFATIAYSTSWVSILIKKEYVYFKDVFNWGGLILLVLSVVSTVLLLSQDIRRYLNINANWLRISIIASLLIACPLVIMIMYN